MRNFHGFKGIAEQPSDAVEAISGTIAAVFIAVMVSHAVRKGLGVVFNIAVAASQQPLHRIERVLVSYSCFGSFISDRYRVLRCNDHHVHACASKVLPSDCNRDIPVIGIRSSS